MKKVCFIVSHLGSGSLDLIDILNKNQKCLFENSLVEYDNPLILEWLFNKKHKTRNVSAIYGDHLVYNMSFSCKKLYELCKFIYVIRPARATLNEIKATKHLPYNEKNATNYYKFRLRRICEMAHHTPDAVLMTWDDLAKGTGFPIIEEYLGLKEQLKVEYHHFPLDVKDDFNESLIEEAQDAYERYYYYLNNLKLRRAF